MLEENEGEKALHKSLLTKNKLPKLMRNLPLSVSFTIQ